MKKGFLLLVVVFGLLLGRLFQLMIFEGSRYRELSEGQRIREKTIRAPRGLIKDRNGIVMVRNKPVYRRSRLKTEGSKEEEMSEVISHEEALRIEAEGGLEAACLEIEVVREYVAGESIAHLVGYTGELSKEEISNKKEDIKKYDLGSKVGRMGVEEQYDDFLRGLDGKELIETDVVGRPLRTLGKIEPEPGKDLVLAIDFPLQKKAMELMKEKKGAVVVSEPKTGEILALVSSPSFDPNRFVDPLTNLGKEGIEEILKDPQEPLFNRAVAGFYPPGSLFKIITAAAALEEGVINGKTEIEDVGAIQIGPYRFSNWFFDQYGKKEGMLNVVKAIQRSNDIFFYKLGERLGVEKLVKWAKKFKAGALLGIDIPGEGKGVVPDPEWKMKFKGDQWFLGDTYHLAIGQGNLLVTPLQVNFWTSVIANGGKLCRPKVLKSAEVASTFLEKQKLAVLEKPRPNSLVRGASRLGRLIANKENFVGSPPLFNLFTEDAWAEEPSCQEIGLSEETIALIKQGMRKACEPGGTGWPLFNFKIKNEKLKIDGKNFLDAGGGLVEIPTGCKTGTAEFDDPKGRTHAWFTVFAPFEEPEILVTVLVEGGGEGSSVAGPIAKEILEEWFER